MLTSYCRICGNSKPSSEYALDVCGACAEHRKQAESAFAAEHPKATSSDVLYAGRMALNQRAIGAHANFVDPRGFSAGKGQMPTRPE